MATTFIASKMVSIVGPVTTRNQDSITKASKEQLQSSTYHGNNVAEAEPAAELDSHHFTFSDHSFASLLTGGHWPVLPFPVQSLLALVSRQG